MGSEIFCTVRTGGKSAKGKALLDTNEVIFRGDLRLRIPFASLKSVSCRDGELHLQWPDGTAVFQLGEQAEKWAHKILHPKSRSEKLGIKPGLVISSVEMRDTNFVEELRSNAKSFSDAAPLKGSDLIFFGAETAADLAHAKTLSPSLDDAGALWIVYPKGRQEITESQVFAAGKQAGLVDVKVVSFSATHTALKFVRPKAQRSR
jgi:hypothetical protein